MPPCTSRVVWAAVPTVSRGHLDVTSDDGLKGEPGALPRAGLRDVSSTALSGTWVSSPVCLRGVSRDCVCKRQSRDAATLECVITVTRHPQTHELIAGKRTQCILSRVVFPLRFYLSCLIIVQILWYPYDALSHWVLLKTGIYLSSVQKNFF